MKRFLFLLLPLIALMSCGKSNEEKAQNLVADKIKENLYHPESYKPLNTKIDSAFVELATDKQSVNLLIEFMQIVQETDKYAKKVESAERSMDIWAPSGYSSAYSNGEYERAKKDRDENQRFLDRYREKALDKFKSIKVRQKDLNLGDFDGWIVSQKYQSLNGAGTLTLTTESVYFCDQNFTDCWGGLSPEEYKQLQQFMKAIEKTDSIQDLQNALIDIM